jgi:catechol 2,3-dioxygenase-like lactoylglutathione lyase family enzyme
MDDHHHDHHPDAGLRLDHVNVRTHQLEAMAGWYHDVLGLHEGPRPDFPFPGAWLYAGDAPVVHLVGVEIAPVADPDTLRLEHFAFRGDDLDAFITKLHGLGVTFRMSRVPGRGITQINVWDPDGNHIHVDFEGK